MRILKPSFYLVLLLPFLGCEALNDLTEQEVDIPITVFVNLAVAVPFDEDPDTPFKFPFSSKSSYSLLNDPVVSNAVDNPEDIVRLRINLVRYEYRNYIGEIEVSAYGDIQIVKPGTVYSYATPQKNIAEADFANTIFTLEGDYATVDNFLSSDKSFEVYHEGTANANPAQFDTYITIDATVTVQVDAGDL